jgi:hypothetical protein
MITNRQPRRALLATVEKRSVTGTTFSATLGAIETDRIPCDYSGPQRGYKIQSNLAPTSDAEGPRSVTAPFVF